MHSFFSLQIIYLTFHWDVSCWFLNLCIVFSMRSTFRAFFFSHWGNWSDSSAQWQTVAFVFTVLDHWARRGREKVYSLLSPVRLFSLCGILLATSCMEPFQRRSCLCFGKKTQTCFAYCLAFTRHKFFSLSLCTCCYTKDTQPLSFLDNFHKI